MVPRGANLAVAYPRASTCLNSLRKNYKPASLSETQHQINILTETNISESAEFTENRGAHKDTLIAINSVDGQRPEVHSPGNESVVQVIPPQGEAEGATHNFGITKSVQEGAYRASIRKRGISVEEPQSRSMRVLRPKIQLASSAGFAAKNLNKGETCSNSNGIIIAHAIDNNNLACREHRLASQRSKNTGNSMLLVARRNNDS